MNDGLKQDSFMGASFHGGEADRSRLEGQKVLLTERARNDKPKRGSINHIQDSFNLTQLSPRDSLDDGSTGAGTLRTNTVDNRRQKRCTAFNTMESVSKSKNDKWLMEDSLDHGTVLESPAQKFSKAYKVPRKEFFQTKSLNLGCNTL